MAIPGVVLPRHPSPQELTAVLAEIDHLLKNSATTLLHLPPLTNPLVSIAVTILTSTSTASYFYDANLFAYSSSLVVQLVLQHGMTPQATPGLCIYSLLCSSLIGDCERAYEVGEVAAKLSTAHNIPAYQCQVHFLFSSLLNFYRNHLRENVPLLRKGLILCTQVGNTLFAAFCAVHIPTTRLWAGDSLEDVTNESVNTVNSLGAQCRFLDAHPIMASLLYSARALMGITSQKDLEESRVRVSPFGSAWVRILNYIPYKTQLYIFLLISLNYFTIIFYLIFLSFIF